MLPRRDKIMTLWIVFINFMFFFYQFSRFPNISKKNRSMLPRRDKIDGKAPIRIWISFQPSELLTYFYFVSSAFFSSLISKLKEI